MISLPLPGDADAIIISTTASMPDNRLIESQYRLGHRLVIYISILRLMSNKLPVSIKLHKAMIRRFRDVFGCAFHHNYRPNIPQMSPLQGFSKLCIAKSHIQKTRTSYYITRFLWCHVETKNLITKEVNKFLCKMPIKLQDEQQLILKT